MHLTHDLSEIMARDDAVAANSPRFPARAIPEGSRSGRWGLQRERARLRLDGRGEMVFLEQLVEIWSFSINELHELLLDRNEIRSQFAEHG